MFTSFMLAPEKFEFGCACAHHGYRIKWAGCTGSALKVPSVTNVPCFEVEEAPNTGEGNKTIRIEQLQVQNTMKRTAIAPKKEIP